MSLKHGFTFVLVAQFLFQVYASLQYRIVFFTCDKNFAGTSAKVIIRLSDKDDGAYGCNATLNENNTNIELNNQGYYENFTCPSDSIRPSCTEKCFIQRVQLKHNDENFLPDFCIESMNIFDITRNHTVFLKKKFYREQWITNKFQRPFKTPWIPPTPIGLGNNVMDQAGKESLKKEQQDYIDKEAKKQKCAFDLGTGKGMMRKCGSGL